MDIQVSPHSGVPIYLQIMQRINGLIAGGQLEPGDELPAIRVLARQLLINPNTVVRAYRELEMEGRVIKRRGAGTYVAEVEPSRAERLQLLRERARTFLRESRELGFEVAEVVTMLQETAIQEGGSLGEPGE